MQKSLKNICAIVLLVGGLWAVNSHAADDQVDNKQDTKNIVEKTAITPATKTGWFGWLWPFGKKTEPIVKVEQKVEQKNGDAKNAVAPKKHYVRSAKDIVFGLTPAAVLFYALFLMPDSVKQHLSKDLLMFIPDSVKKAKYLPEKFLMFLKDKNCLMLLNNPKVMGTLCSLAGFYLSHKISKVRNNLLNSENIVDVGGQAGQKAIVGALADPGVQKNAEIVLKNTLMAFLEELYSKHPGMIFDLLRQVNLLSVGGGSGVSNETFEKLAAIISKDIGILVTWASSLDKKQDETLKKLDETLKIITEMQEVQTRSYKLQKRTHKYVKENQTFTNMMYNKVAAFGAGVARRIENIDFDIYSPFPEEVDFRYSTAEVKE